MIMAQTGRGTLPPAMYMPKRVRWIVELSHDPCRPVRFTPAPGDDPRGQEYLVPFLRRTASVTPLLLADKPSYTFGVRVADGRRDAGRNPQRDVARTLREHHAYKDLLRACAVATNEADVARVAAFLDSWNPAAPFPALPGDLGCDDLITFRVDGARPIDSAAVQRFWARAAAGEGTGEAENASEHGGPASRAMQCLISGDVGPVWR